MSVTRDQLLSKRDELFPIEEVQVPEIGDSQTIRVRALNARQRWAWAVARDKAIIGEKGTPEPTSLLVAMAAVDDGGKRLFTDSDAEYVADLPGGLVDRVAEKILEMSGLTDKAAVDAEGNSDATQSGDSPSDSPATSD